jgi:hypothetical protein
MEPAVRKKKPSRRLQLSETLITKWAKAYFKRTGRWPGDMSGPVTGVPGMTWGIVNYALEAGTRGLPGGETLSHLLHLRVGKRPGPLRTPLRQQQISKWARQHFARTGHWPSSHSGRVVGGQGETWASLDQALRQGCRGLPGGSTLARLLDSVAGPTRRRKRPPFTLRQILQWADQHKKRTGDWPNVGSGSIHGAPGESWRKVNAALRSGCRGLPRGDSLAGILCRYRGRPLGQGRLRRPLSDSLVLKWADAYYRRHGRWPSLNSGRVPEAPELFWKRINFALRLGLYGLVGDRSLAQLLREERGSSASYVDMPVTVNQILRWVDAYHRQTGRWPSASMGRRTEGMPLTWVTIARRLGSGQVPGAPVGTRICDLIAERWPKGK